MILCVDEVRLRIARSFGIDPERLSLWPTAVPAILGSPGPGPWAVQVEGLTWAEYGQLEPAARKAGAVIVHPDAAP